MLNPAYMIVLLGYVAIPLVLLIAFVLGRTNEERTRRTIKSLRLSTSLILVACAWIIFGVGITLRTPALLIALGMTFGALGDLVLAEVIPLPKRMISGIIIFAIGHICYIAAFSQAARSLGLNDPFTGSLLWVVFVIIAAALWFFLIYNPAKPRVLNIGSLGYGWLIAIMAGTATALALSDPRFTLTAVGGVLFLISDIILGNRELRDNAWFLVHDVIWVLYITGQALIVLTLVWV
ncbi:MAG TPA: lysoplasmalogenase [Anaerolineae bacterium]|nr:lysoplasmalogenase [Anaerolineae bacterium]